jgi:hypothetical protein
MDPQHVVEAARACNPYRAFQYKELSGLYFAYGSNMNELQIRTRCTNPVVVGIARLADHRIAFFGHSRTWDGGMETVIAAPGEDIWGVLYQLSFLDWDRLDAWQDARLDGTGAYFHYPVHVTDTAGSDLVVLLYKKDLQGEAKMPSREYLNHIVQGALKHGLPSAYVDKLGRIEAVTATYKVPRASAFNRGLLVETPCSECAERQASTTYSKAGPSHSPSP